MGKSVLTAEYGLAAITVKYLGATNYKSSRYKAVSQCGSVTLALDYALDVNANAWRAAELLIEKNEWEGNWTMGHLPNGDYVFVRQVK